MDLTKFIQKEILNNKEEIDCFGISYDEKNTSETKCYRFCIDKDKKSGIYNFEIALDTNSKQREYYKVITNRQKEQQELLNKFYSRDIYKQNNILQFIKMIDGYFSDGKEHLSHIGRKVTDGKIEEFKLYFTLRRFENENDVKGEPIIFRDNKVLFEKIHKHWNITKQKGLLLEKISAVVEENSYYPSFLGLNVYENSVEYKLYFELFDYTEPLDEIIQKSWESLQSITKYYNFNCKQIKDDMYFMKKHHYFIRGFTLSLNNKSSDVKLKLYYFLIDKFA